MKINLMPTAQSKIDADQFNDLLNDSEAFEDVTAFVIVFVFTVWTVEEVVAHALLWDANARVAALEAAAAARPV